MRWAGFEHRQLFEMINNGAGPQASAPHVTYWNGLTKELVQVDEDLNRELGKMGATWEGDASDSAKSGLTPLAEWAADAETGSTAMATSAESQGDGIADARSSMPPPVEVTTPAPSAWEKAAAGAASAVGIDGPAESVARQAADHEQQEAAKNEAEMQAVATMEVYQVRSTINSATLGEFVPPPSVVVDTPPPKGGSNVAVTGTLSGPAVTPTGGDQVTSSSGFVPTNSGGSSTPLVTSNVNGGTGAPLPQGNGGQLSPIPTGPQGTTPSQLPTNPTGPTGPSGPAGPKGPYLPQGPNTSGPNGPYGPYGQVPPTGTGNSRNNNTAARTPNHLGNRSLVPPGGLPANQGANQAGQPRGALPPGARAGFPGAPLAAGEADAARSASQLGRGGAMGSGAGGPGAGATPGAQAAAGRPGGPAGAGRGMAGPMGAGGRRADGEDDDEHFAPDYLMETNDVFGDDRKIAPTVIGEPQ